jgi:hypothetical protein
MGQSGDGMYVSRQQPNMTLALVVTTISNGEFLREYARAIGNYGGGEVAVYVIGDLNTPPECKSAVARLRADGITCTFVDVEEQERFLAPFAMLRAEIPYRSDNRRNVGYLMALRDGNDVVISVDDDNLPIPDSPFFEGHSIVGQHIHLPVVAGDGHWCNVCALLDTRTHLGEPMRIYPRGFPYAARGEDNTRVRDTTATGTVGVNIGLWTGDPDVDAPTRLVTGCDASARDRNRYFLAKGQRTPINSQNTALVSEAVPAYYFLRMGETTGGMRMDRYGDIFSGYFLGLCAEAAGHRICVGPPFVYQARNEHNLFKDMWHELPGMVLIEDLRELLEQPLTPASGYDEAYLELADRLLQWAHRRKGFLWGAELVPYVERMTLLMREWVDACRGLTYSGGIKTQQRVADHG